MVEITGETTAELAALQDKKLADVGVRVLRFSDEQVLEDGDAVVAATLAELQKPFDRRKELKANASGRRAAEDETVFDTDADEGSEE